MLRWQSNHTSKEMHILELFPARMQFLQCSMAEQSDWQMRPMFTSWRPVMKVKQGSVQNTEGKIKAFPLWPKPMETTTKNLLNFPQCLRVIAYWTFMEIKMVTASRVSHPHPAIMIVWIPLVSSALLKEEIATDWINRNYSTTVVTVDRPHYSTLIPGFTHYLSEQVIFDWKTWTVIIWSQVLHLIYPMTYWPSVHLMLCDTVSKNLLKRIDLLNKIKAEISHKSPPITTLVLSPHWMKKGNKDGLNSVNHRQYLLFCSSWFSMRDLTDCRSSCKFMFSPFSQQINSCFWYVKS